MNFVLKLLLILMLPLAALAQPPRPDCQQMLRDGEQHEAREELSKALQAYLNALNCDPNLSGPVGPKVQAVFQKIENQKQREKTARGEAERAKQDIETKARELFTNSLAFKAQAEEDRSIAFRLAEAAVQSAPDNAAGMQELINAYYFKEGPIHSVVSWDGGRPIVNSSGQSLLLKADDDGGTQVWDIRTRKLLHTMPGRYRWNVFSPDGEKILSIAADSTATIREFGSHRPFTRLPEKQHFHYACFSPDGSQVLATFGSGTVKVWDADTGVELYTLESHKQEVTTAAFSPDGKTIVTASRDNYLKVWDVESKQERYKRYAHSDIFGHVSFSPDGKSFILPSYLATYGWETATGRTIFILEDTDIMVSAAFSPNGEKIITGNDGGKVKLWDVASRKELATIPCHNQPISTVAYFLDNNSFLTTSGDGLVKAWKFPAQEYWFNTAAGDSGSNLRWPESITYSSDGSQAAGWGSRQLKVWDMATQKELAVFEEYISSFTSASFSPGGSLLASSLRDGAIKIWDITTRQLLLTLRDEEKKATSADFSPDGHKILAVSKDNSAVVWGLASRQILFSLSGQQSRLRSARFSADGQHIITTSDDGTVKAWNALSGKEVFTIQEPVKTEYPNQTVLTFLEGHRNGVVAASLSPSGNMLVTASNDKTTKVWNVHTKKEICTLRGHNSHVKSAAFSPDEKWIITTAYNDKPRVWEASTGLPLMALDTMARSGQFSSDGKKILTAGPTVKIWDAVSGALLSTIGEDWPNLWFARFSPDGEKILAMFWGGLAKVWDTKSGKELCSCTEYTKENIYNISASFSPDGKKFIITPRNGIAKVFDGQSCQELYAFPSSSRGRFNGYRPVSFSPNGRWMASVNPEGETDVWDFNTGSLLFELKGYKGYPVNTFFHPNPDYPQLMIATEDKTYRFWLDPDSLLAEASQKYAIAELTPEQIARFELEEGFEYMNILDQKGSPAPLIREGKEEKMLNYANFFALRAREAGGPEARKAYLGKAKMLYRACEKKARLHPPEYYRKLSSTLTN